MDAMDYPLHLGVTEVVMVSTVGSVHPELPLLADGISDTIRVSLTEAPENSCYSILQALGLRKNVLDT